MATPKWYPITKDVDEYNFSFYVNDARGIERTSITDSNFLVTGPNGFSKAPTVIDVLPPDINATRLFVEAKVAGPFTAANDGSYQLVAIAGGVKDIGNFAPSTPVVIAEFDCTIAKGPGTGSGVFAANYSRPDKEDLEEGWGFSGGNIDLSNEDYVRFSGDASTGPRSSQLVSADGDLANLPFEVMFGTNITDVAVGIIEDPREFGKAGENSLYYHFTDQALKRNGAVVSNVTGNVEFGEFYKLKFEAVGADLKITLADFNNDVSPSGGEYTLTGGVALFTAPNVFVEVMGANQACEFIYVKDATS